MNGYLRPISEPYISYDSTLRLSASCHFHPHGDVVALYPAWVIRRGLGRPWAGSVHNRNDARGTRVLATSTDKPSIPLPSPRTSVLVLVGRRLSQCQAMPTLPVGGTLALCMSSTLFWLARGGLREDKAASTSLAASIIEGAFNSL